MRGFNTREEAMNHLRTKFTSAYEVKRMMEEYNIVLKRGEYNSYEASRIDGVIREFLQENQLSMKDLHSFLLDEFPSFPIRELLVTVSNVLECRSMNSVWIYVSYHYHPYVDAKWEPENEIQLLNLVRVLGFKWKEICGIMNKSSRRCISNYHRIMGTRSICKSGFKLSEDEIPTTEEEWGGLCEKLRTNRKRLSHLINGYITSKLVVPLWNEYNNMELIAYVILYNHFCSVRIKIQELREFINGSNTEEMPGDESVNRDRIRSEISKFVPDVTSYCLDIPVEIDDIFWRTVKIFLEFPSGLLRSRFVQLSKMYGIRTFGDLVNVLYDVAVNCYLYKIKDRLKEEVNSIINSNTRRRG